MSKSGNRKNKDTGDQGEQIALHYLHGCGYEILDTNWRYGKGELDIVAKTKNTLIIAEVKTRTSAKHGNPVETITKKQQEILFKTATAYCEENSLSLGLRFDIIAILMEPETTLEHIEDAFRPY